MLQKDIVVGGLYRAKVSGRLTTVRVDDLGYTCHPKTRRETVHYLVTNLKTGRKIVFRSPQKFRGAAVEGGAA